MAAHSPLLPVTQTLREYAVPNWLADVLERSEGVRWQWNLPDFVPLVGGKDAYVGFTKLNNALKSYKFVLAPAQAVDLTFRKMFGGHYHTGYRIDQWAKSTGRDSAELLSLYFKGPETRRRAVLDIAQSTEEIFPGRPRINHKNYVRVGGLAGADKSWMLRLSKEMLPETFERELRTMNVPMEAIQKSMEWFRDGMFEVAYRMNIIRYMDEIEVPRQMQLHPDWDDEAVMQTASRNANRKFSSPQEWDNFIFLGPKFQHALRNVFLSVNEMMSWTSMLTESLPIPRRFDVDAEGKRVLSPSHSRLIADDTYRVLRPDENSADVVTGREWGMFNTDSSSFAGSFMSIMGSYAVISSIMEFTSEGEVDPMMYSPVSQNPNSPLGFGYNAGFLSPGCPWVDRTWWKGSED